MIGLLSVTILGDVGGVSSSFGDDLRLGILLGIPVGLRWWGGVVTVLCWWEGVVMKWCTKTSNIALYGEDED